MLLAPIAGPPMTCLASLGARAGEPGDDLLSGQRWRAGRQRLRKLCHQGTKAMAFPARAIYFVAYATLISQSDVLMN
jgi:hypothetical protein